MIMTIYKRAFAVLMSKPVKLWGISLLAILLTAVLTALCGVAIPILGISISLLLGTSLLMVFLRGYRGEDVQITQLFDCFKDWATIKRVVLGLGWMLLWILLWGLIPIVGPIIAIIRSYEYRLTPYILVTEPEVPLTEAIKISKARTEGYKLKMWGADILVFLILWGAFFILGLLCAIPVIGALFALVTTLAWLAVVALSPLFFGLVQAAFYEEIRNPTIPTVKVGGNYGFCTKCGAPYLSESALFCANCGAPKS